jgi:hypothetical protein
MRAVGDLDGRLLPLVVVMTHSTLNEDMSMDNDLLAAPGAETVTAAAVRPETTGHMAPHVLLRYATQPAARLDAMRLRRTEAHLAAHRDARCRMAFLAAALGDDLHALVPRLGEQETGLRRAVLQLRRDVHHGRPTQVKPAACADVQARLAGACAAAAARLADWLAAQDALGRHWLAAQEAFAAELQQVLRPALRAPLADASFMGALALANPGVAAQARRERRWPDKPQPDTFERSLMGYLMRACAKTSPLSSFMATSSLSWSGQPGVGLPRLQQERLACRTRLNRGVSARLERALRHRLAREGHVALQVNPSFTALPDGRFRALCSRDLVLLKRPWREQRRAQFQLHAGVGRALVEAGPQAPRTWAAWADTLQAAGVPVDQVPALLDKLLRRDLLQVAPLVDGYTDRPEQALAASALPATPAWQAAGAALQALTRSAALVAQGDAAQRADAIAALPAQEAAALELLGEPDAAPLQNLVVEDCWATLRDAGGLARIGAGAPEWSGLQDLREFLATQVEISPQYVKLRAHFLARYGVAGVCDDVAGFLTEVSDKLVEVNEYGNALREGEAAPARPGALMGVTAQVQLVPAAGPGRPARLVVNKVFDRPAWLAARFAFGDTAQHELLRAELAEWLQTLSGDAEPVDVMVNGHCNELQAHPRLTQRVLAWHGEPLCVPAEQQLPVAALSLRHDPASGLLELAERAGGRRINLLYLGATFPTANWGVPFALAILTQPYRLQRPAAAPPQSGSEEGGRGDAPAFVAQPRLERGAVVLRRAAWWVRGAHLRSTWLAGDGAARLLAAQDDCERHGVPLRFFAQGAVAQRHDLEVSSEVLDGYRKPLWVDVRNPFCLALLERMAERFEWLTFSEALPDPAESWLELDGQCHVAELQIEMMVAAA